MKLGAGIPGAARPPVRNAAWDDPDARPLIRFQGVAKRFGDVVALDGVDLDINAGEFFALLGPSGCGKTTLMRLLAGFETPSAGRVSLDGQDLAGVPPNRRPVNMMFQSYALFPHLTVAGNIAFGLKRDGLGRDRIAARVDEMLSLTRLDGLGGRKPHQISGGQRQRVALARALAKAPKLLLLDEPLAALDRKLRQATQLELVDIQKRTGTTFVVVTHDQEEAMTMASRIGVMADGRLAQVDTPDGIYETPASVFVAGFVGEVTLIEGRARPAGPGRYTLHWAEGEPPLTAASRLRLDRGQTCHLAIRPEKVAIGADRPAERSNALKGRVHDVAYLGHLSTYHVEVAPNLTVKAQIANTRRIARRGFGPGDEVWLSWTDTAGVLLER